MPGAAFNAVDGISTKNPWIRLPVYTWAGARLYPCLKDGWIIAYSQAQPTGYDLDR